MNDLLFLGALLRLHEIFKCRVGLCEAVLLATLEALLVVACGSRARKRTLSSLAGAWPGCAGCWCICVSCLLELPCLHCEIKKSVYGVVQKIK